MSLKKLLVTAVMLSGLLIFAAQPSKTVEVDIKSQIKAANDAETQEKNAMKLAQWWMREIYNTIQFSDVKVEAEKGELRLKWTVKQDKQKVESLAEEMARMLSINGYKREDIKTSATTVFCRDFKGSTFVTKAHFEWGKNQFECYNNPNVCLFWGDKNNNHPQNFQTHIEVGCIEIVALKKDNSKKRLTKIDIGDKLGLLHGYGDEESENCSLLFRLYYNPSADRKNPIDKSYYMKMSAETIKDVIGLQFNAVFVAENGKGKRETVTLATFPLTNTEQLVSNAEAQAGSLAKRSQDLSNVVVKYLRDIYKCIDVNASYKYNRFKKKGELEIELSTNLPEYAKWNQNFISSLEALNIKINEKGLSGLPDSESGCTRLWINRKWWAHIPDHDRGVLAKTSEQLKNYRYYVEVQFKDASGKMLQRKEFKLPSGYSGDNRDASFQHGNFSHANAYNDYIASGIYWGEYAGTPKKSTEGSFSIKFDVPEDAQKVSKVECAIIERNEQ